MKHLAQLINDFPFRLKTNLKVIEEHEQGIERHFVYEYLRLKGLKNAILIMRKARKAGMLYEVSFSYC